MKHLALDGLISPKKYYLILMGTYLVQILTAAFIVILSYFVLPSKITSGFVLPRIIFLVCALLFTVFTQLYRAVKVKNETPESVDLLLSFFLNLILVSIMACLFAAAYSGDGERSVVPLEAPENWLFLFFIAATSIYILACFTARFRAFFDKLWKYLGASPAIVFCIIAISGWLPQHDWATNIFCVIMAIIFSLLGGYELFQATKCEKTLANAIDEGIRLFLYTFAVFIALGTTKHDD